MRLQYFNLNNGLTLFILPLNRFRFNVMWERKTWNYWLKVNENISTKDFNAWQIGNKYNFVRFFCLLCRKVLAKKRKSDKSFDFNLKWFCKIATLWHIHQNYLSFSQNYLFRFGVASITWKCDYRTKGKREFFPSRRRNVSEYFFAACCLER